MDLIQLQNVLTNTALNLSEIQSKLYDMYFNPISKTVSFTYIDPNTGNQSVLNIPNHAKLFSDLKTVKTFYVNQSSGSNSNNGTSASTPYASLQRAIDSIPNGGTAIIKIIGDYTLNSDETVENRTIYIYGDLDNTGVPMYTFRNSTSNANSRFKMRRGANVHINQLKIEANNNGNSSAHWGTIFKCDQAVNCGLFIGTWVPGGSPRKVDIILNYPLLNVESSIASVFIRGTKLTSNSPRSLITSQGNGKYIYGHELVTDTNGNVTFPNIGLN